MNPIATQQAALDNALVPSEKGQKIERCNARIAILNQDFVTSPSEEDLVTFIQKLGYSGRCASLGKQQDLIDSGSHELKYCGGMYNKKNADYVALLWEDFMYQADKREISLARKEHMPYPRFTKVIINHFISKDKTISMRNRINLHTMRDDSLLSTLKFTYYDFATGKGPPKKARKYKKVASPLRKLSPIKEAEPVKKAKRGKRPAKKSTTVPTAGVVLRDTPGVSVSKKKAPTKVDKSKGIEILYDVALLEVAQLKEATKRSKKDFHISQTSGSESNDESWGDSEDDNDDEGDNNDDNDDASKGDDDKANSDDDDLYKDVDVRSLGIEHEKERQGDEEMTDADQNVS
ncbi:hypothetical protein Tco_1460805 [Tanacetum coccineum]